MHQGTHEGDLKAQTAPNPQPVLPLVPDLFDCSSLPRPKTCNTKKPYSSSQSRVDSGSITKRHVTHRDTAAEDAAHEPSLTRALFLKFLGLGFRGSDCSEYVLRSFDSFHRSFRLAPGPKDCWVWHLGLSIQNDRFCLWCSGLRLLHEVKAKSLGCKRKTTRMGPMLPDAIKSSTWSSQTSGRIRKVDPLKWKP